MTLATKTIWQGVHTGGGLVCPGETQVKHQQRQENGQRREVKLTTPGKTVKIEQQVYKITYGVASHILKNKSAKICWHFVIRFLSVLLQIQIV